MPQQVSKHRDTSLEVRAEGSRYLYHFAMEYWDRGWSVIPLHGKRPTLASWKEFQSRRPTSEELRLWFAHDSPTGVGIVTGSVSQLVVVDTDTPADTAWWRKAYPVSPLAVETGRGGQHLYYRRGPEPVGNRTKIFRRAIDLRAEGGYVVAPPSLHPGTGRPYCWIDPRCFDAYSWKSLPEFDPDWLSREREITASNVVVRCLDIESPRSGRTLRRIRGLIRYLDQHEGEPDRSARDFGVCMALLRLGCSPGEVEQLVAEHSKFRGNRDYLLVTIENAVKAFQNETA